MTDVYNCGQMIYLFVLQSKIIIIVFNKINMNENILRYGT